jgi:hypothetical protein
MVNLLRDSGAGITRQELAVGSRTNSVSVMIHRLNEELTRHGWQISSVNIDRRPLRGAPGRRYRLVQLAAANRQVMTERKYTIEVCPPGGVRAGVEGIIASDDDLTAARKIYRAAAADNPGRVVMLRQSGRILARSAQPNTVPE